MALAVRRRAGAHGGRPVVVDLDAGELAAAATGRDLHIGGDADAERDAVAALAPLGLLAAQAVVAGDLGGDVERAARSRRCRR